MESEGLPERVEDDGQDSQDSDGTFKVPEEAKPLVTRLILSRQWQKLLERKGSVDSSPGREERADSDGPA